MRDILHINVVISFYCNRREWYRSKYYVNNELINVALLHIKHIIGVIKFNGDPETDPSPWRIDLATSFIKVR